MWRPRSSPPFPTYRPSPTHGFIYLSPNISYFGPYSWMLSRIFAPKNAKDWPVCVQRAIFLSTCPNRVWRVYTADESTEGVSSERGANQVPDPDSRTAMRVTPCGCLLLEDARGVLGTCHVDGEESPSFVYSAVWPRQLWLVNPIAVISCAQPKTSPAIPQFASWFQVSDTSLDGGKKHAKLLSPCVFYRIQPMLMQKPDQNSSIFAMIDISCCTTFYRGIFVGHFEPPLSPAPSRISNTRHSVSCYSPRIRGSFIGHSSPVDLPHMTGFPGSRGAQNGYTDAMYVFFLPLPPP